MGNIVQRYLRHNLGLKLLSLGLAVGLWLAVARDPVAEVAVEVPIEFHNIPENLEIGSETIPRAQIRMRGPEAAVHRLEPASVHAELDLSGVRPGEHTFNLTAQQVHQPHELQVVQIIPSQFRLSFDTRLTKRVDVHPRVIGNFASDYQIEKVQSDPANILITGPRKRVEAVDAAITDPVDVSGTMHQSTFVTHAYVADPLVQVVNPRAIRVTVTMEKVSAPPAATAPTK
jgi:diadenylate cyclase